MGNSMNAPYQCKPGETLRDAQFSCYNSPTAVLAIADRCVIDNITISGTGSIGVTIGKRCSVSNLRVSGFDIGIRIADSWIVTLNSPMVCACGVGLAIGPNANNINVNGGAIECCAKAVNITGGNMMGVIFNGTCIESSNQCGVYVLAGIRGLQFRSCYFERNISDIVLLATGISGTIVDGCQFVGSTLAIDNRASRSTLVTRCSYCGGVELIKNAAQAKQCLVTDCVNG